MNERISDDIPEGLRSENNVFTRGLTENHPEKAKRALSRETELANRYQEGDIVTTPDRGVGVIAGAVAEDQSAPDDTDLPDIEASPDSPTYVVVDRFCGAFLDEVLGYEAWRGDSPLPGD